MAGFFPWPALLVDCPFCPSKAGAPCFDLEDDPMEPHEERVTPGLEEERRLRAANEPFPKWWNDLIESETIG